MQEKKLTQTELAGILGIAQSQVSNWINARSEPKYSSLKVLKNRLKLSADEFFGT